MTGDHKNLVLAIGASLLIILGWEAFFAPPAPVETETEAVATEAAPQPAPAPAGNAAVAPQPVPTPQPAAGQMPTPAVPAGNAGVPPVPGAGQAPLAGALPPAAGTEMAARTALLGAVPRVSIRSDRLTGSIALTGARLDDLVLQRYGVTPETNSPRITLFSPPGAPKAYFARFGWTPGEQGVRVPDDNTRWTASGPSLTPQRPLTLSWNNGQGLTFILTFRIDDGYLFTVSQRVENAGNQPVTLYPFGLVSRTGTPEVTQFYILHEGLIGVHDGILEEIDYDDLQEDKVIKHESSGGWIGITDKYWLAALALDEDVAVQTRYSYLQGSDQTDRYQVDFLSGPQTVPAGGAIDSRAHLFAGAKVVSLLDRYQAEYGFTDFDKAVDFGWFYFLTKPIFYAITWLYGWLGNFGLAIIVLTLAIKAAFYPLANKSYRAMAKMKKLQPEMLKVREEHGDDKMRMNQEMMALYKREGANPAAGCLPILVQIPVFFALYKVLFVTLEMRHAPFYGWITDLSAPDPTSMFNLFGLLAYTPPEWLPPIGIWPVLMGASMFLQQKLNPQPPDPMQAKIFLMMPFVFTILLASFPAGLVIYWTVNNLLSITQQWIIMKRVGAA